MDNVAAFIGEPVQGAGGVIIPPDTYWPEIQRICDEYGILLVADEVITGFGRLGEWFGSQYFDIEPDLIIFAKAVNSGYLPLGGVLVGDRVAESLVDEGGEFYHGFTYSGNPVACAVGDRHARGHAPRGHRRARSRRHRPVFRQAMAGPRRPSARRRSALCRARSAP